MSIAVMASLGVVLLMWLPVVDPLPEIELWYEDKWQHALTYALLSGIWFIAGLRPAGAALLAAFLSVLLECGQYFIPYRGFELLDLAANFTGCLIAYASLRAYRQASVLAQTVSEPA